MRGCASGRAALLSKVSFASGLPLVADADTGFGEEEMVRRVVHEYANAGAQTLRIYIVVGRLIVI